MLKDTCEATEKGRNQWLWENGEFSDSQPRTYFASAASLCFASPNARSHASHTLALWVGLMVLIRILNVPLTGR